MPSESLCGLRDSRYHQSLVKYTLSNIGSTLYKYIYTDAQGLEILKHPLSITVCRGILRLVCLNEAHRQSQRLLFWSVRRAQLGRATSWHPFLMYGEVFGGTDSAAFRDMRRAQNHDCTLSDYWASIIQRQANIRPATRQILNSATH